ncbi:trypsin-like peptidase domain-containing protein [Clostridium sp. D2Q-11]|uniref:Trypsin-like peptidase domain-containing protein n=1 Tax=Anaeromonas frigoriresistens TaxID=2683708 RepID=A0A942Z8Q3_9FIRM|nr:trypsin-like peptidase domain-containing protein [Anaeromonas frigoriresistens]MBS4538508.1 trypsin-like peptidase domain-containing protein [Anaeromonas frigoriresistens]
MNDDNNSIINGFSGDSEREEKIENNENKQWHSPAPNTKAPVYREKEKPKRGFISYFIVALVAALIGGLISAYIAPQYLYGNIIPIPNNGGNVNPQNITINSQEDMNIVSAVAEKSMNSVVGITTMTTQQNFFGNNVPLEGVGSGVIIESNGYILTNSHVIDNGQADEITVQFADGSKSIAEVLWNESALDLAIIKVNDTNLPVAELGDSDDLIVGEPAIAIGNPLGLQFQRTVTSGVISGLDRTIASENVMMENLIQTDASINPGNSGGALLNKEGKVIGINTAKITSAEGLGFSVPINIAKPVIEQIISEGEFNMAFMGVSGIEVSKYEKALGVDIEAEEGFIIIEVVPGSPAAVGGIQQNDIITKIGDKEVTNYTTLRKALYNHKPGDTTEITIIRNGENKKLDITFKETPKEAKNK